MLAIISRNSKDLSTKTEFCRTSIRIPKHMDPKNILTKSFFPTWSFFALHKNTIPKYIMKCTNLSK